jgi:hypothetical protein
MACWPRPRSTGATWSTSTAPSNATSDIDVDFDLNDALERLLADGIVVEEPDGTLRTLPPAAAAKHIDNKWDGFLNLLTEDKEDLGIELDTGTEAQRGT